MTTQEHRKTLIFGGERGLTCKSDLHGKKSYGEVEFVEALVPVSCLYM